MEQEKEQRKEIYLGSNHRLVEDPRQPDEWYQMLCPRWGKVGFVPKDSVNKQRVCICGYTSHGPAPLEKVNGST